MKKLNLEFIKKADYILVFLCATIGLLFFLASLSFIVYDMLSRHSSYERSVTRIETEEEQSQEPSEDNPKEEIEEKESIKFQEMIKDVYVFRVTDPKIRIETRLSSKYGKEKTNIDNGLTNFLFIYDQKEEYKLFPTNSQYIRNFLLYNYNEKDSVRYNLYTVIKADTNNDKYLDDNDDISFYISDYNGKKLMEVSSSIMSLEHISGYRFLFTEFHDNELKYYVFDCAKREKKLIKSVKQKVEDKIIYLN